MPEHIPFLNRLPQYNQYKAQLIFSLLEQLGKARNRPIKVLDMGCGTGELLTIPLAELFSTNPLVSIVGRDIHKESIVRAIENLEQTNLSNLSFSEAGSTDQHGSFDIVVCSEVLEHVLDTKSFLLQLKKEIKPDGLLILTIPNGIGAFEIESFLYHKSGVRKIWAVIKKVFRPGNSNQKTTSTTMIIETLNEENNFHIHHFRYWQIVQILQNIGFRIIEKKGVILFGGPLSHRILERAPWLFRCNVNLAQKLPVWLSSGWVFICEG